MGATDNENVVAPPGGLTTSPSKTGGKWRNLVLISAGIAALVGGSGWIGFGVGYQYEVRPTLGSAERRSSDVVVPLMVHETYAGEFAAGGSGFVMTGLTPDGSLLIRSGALILGPDASPKIVASGAYLKIGGLPQVSEGNTLEVSDTISGAQLKGDGGLVTTTNDGTGVMKSLTASAAIIKVGNTGIGETGAVLLCRKTTGVIGVAGGCTALTGYCTECN